MRELLPLRQTLQAVGKGMGISKTSLTTFKTTVWEDNAGALALAKLDPGQHTACSRHFDVKTHWFRSKLKGNEEADNQGDIVVEKIDTKDQLADMFTKPLPQETFEFLRRKLMGW